MEILKFEKDLYFNASSFFRQVNKIVTQEIANTGLTPSYAFLIVAAKEKPGIRTTELSIKLSLDSSTITRLIEKLESKSLILRDSTPGISQVYLTESGEEIYEKVITAIGKYQDQFKNVLGKKQHKELIKNIQSSMNKLRKIHAGE